MTALIALDTWLALVTKGAVVLATALLIARLLRQRSAAVRYLVLAVSLSGLVVLPLAARVVPSLRLPVGAWQPSIAGTEAPALARSSGGDLASRSLDASIVPTRHVASAAGERRSAAPIDVAAMVIGAWLLGAALLLARIAWGLTASRRVAAASMPLEGDEWLIRLESAALEIGCHRPVRLLESSRVPVPVTCGLLRPAILLPTSSRAWDDDRARVVLLHELAHVVRYDCLVHVVAQAGVALHWMNPLAWMAASRLRFERERACDDLVLAAGTTGPAYAEHLLDIARGAGRGPALEAAALAMARPSELEGRLLAVLDRTMRRGAAGRRAVLAALIVSLAGATLVAAVTLTPLDPNDMQAPSPAPTPTPSPSPTPAPSPMPAPSSTGGGRARGLAPLGPSTGLRGDVGGVAGGVGGGVAGGVVAGSHGEGRRSSGQDATPLPPAVRQSVVQALVTAMKDESPEVRAQAIQALVQVRSPEVFEPMLAALSDVNPEIRQQAAMALGRLEDVRALPALVKSLSDADAQVRHQSAFALGQLDDPGAAPALEKALGDGDIEVRQQAAFALARVGGPSSVPGLITALGDASPDVRQQAAFALARLGDARAVEPLTRLLKDKEPEVRQQAAFALGRVLDQEE